MKLIKTLIVAIFFILAITFALQNQQPMTLHYYGLIPDFSIPVFLLVFFAILLGILIGGFGDLFMRYSMRMRARRCEKELKRVKEELASLKRREDVKEIEGPEKAEAAKTPETPSDSSPPEGS